MRNRLHIQYQQKYTFVYIWTYLPQYISIWAPAFQREMIMNTSTSFVKWMLKMPQRCVNNVETDTDAKKHTDTNTDSTHYDWDLHAADGESWRFSWSVCHLRRSGCLQVKSVEANSTINYQVKEWVHDWLVQWQEQENGHLGESHGMAWFGICFCLLSSVCLLSVFLHDLVFYRHDNTLQEC